MGYTRMHELNGRNFGTCADDGGTIVVPVSEIEGVSAEEIGKAVLSLVGEAEITSILDWLDTFELNTRWPENYPEKQRHTQVCMLLASDDDISGLRRKFKEVERLKDKDDMIRYGYSSLRDLLGNTHAYLRSKKSKLTPLQSTAKQVILELRNGCPLCGLLDGFHTQQCQHLTVMNPT